MIRTDGAYGVSHLSIGKHGDYLAARVTDYEASEKLSPASMASCRVYEYEYE